MSKIDNFRISIIINCAAQNVDQSELGKQQVQLNWVVKLSQNMQTKKIFNYFSSDYV